jgi:hypothetical protein
VVQYKEDIKYGKSNLYLQFDKKPLFWYVYTFLVFGGITLSYLLSPLSSGVLILLYILNGFYSIPPIKIRNRPFLREILIFIIYFIKWILVMLYMHYSIIHFPLIIVIMTCSFVSYGLVLYKRHIKDNIIAEYTFGFIFLISLFWTIIQYKSLFLLFFPLVPLGIFVQVRYRKKQIPFGVFQFIYFCYTVLLFYLYQ